MKCEWVRDRLSAFIDGELSEIERIQVESHLGRCAGCALEERLLRHTVAILQETEEVEVPADFRVRLHERLVALPSPVEVALVRVRPLPLWRRWGLSAATGAAAAAVAFAVWASNVRPPLTAAPPPTPPAPSGAPVTPGAPVAVSPAPQPASPPAGTEPAAPPPPAPAAPTPGTQPAAPAPPDPAAPAPQPDTAPINPRSLVGGIKGASDDLLLRLDTAAPQTLVHWQYHLTVVVSDLEGYEARVAEALNTYGVKVTRELQDRTRAKVNILVPVTHVREAVETLQGIGSVKGQVVPSSDEMSGAYNTAVGSLKSRLDADKDLQAKLSGASPALQEAIKTDISRNRAEINSLVEEIDLYVSRYHHAVIVLTLEESPVSFTD